MAEPDVFALSCMTCVLTERLAPEDAADLVGGLRAFFIRHGDCVTSVDLTTYHGTVPGAPALH